MLGGIRIFSEEADPVCMEWVPLDGSQQSCYLTSENDNRSIDPQIRAKMINKALLLAFTVTKFVPARTENNAR